MSNLVLMSQVDPRNLAINKRYKTNHTLPPEVRDAKQNLTDDVYEAILCTPDWQPIDDTYISLDFVFPNKRSDLDGPLKHTIDAIQDGIKKAGMVWDDRLIKRIILTRYQGPPGIGIVVWGD